MSHELTVSGNQGSHGGAMIDVASSRQAQEVQAMMVVAKKFPRDETQAMSNILKACHRKGLAEQALYSYPKGKKMVEGPSIRLAEQLARSWGNVDFGVMELDQRDGESDMMSYCWDLETNVRETKVFTVRHWRDTKEGGHLLTDSRDIYEIGANMGARRLRACILGIIPIDVIEMAVEQVNKTLAGDNAEPLSDRVSKMVIRFQDVGVTKEMIETRLQHSIKACTATQVVEMGKIFLSIRDGVSKREDWFQVQAPSATSTSTKSKTEQVAEKEAEKKQEKKTRKTRTKKTEEPETEEPQPQQSTEPTEKEGAPEREKKTEPAKEPRTATTEPEEDPEPDESFADAYPVLAEYIYELQQATNEAQVRGSWAIHVFDRKDALPDEVYGCGCELRDRHLKRVRTPKQGTLL